MLELYRTARREHPALGDGTMTWQDATEGALSFSREPGFACLVNLSAEPCVLPARAELLLTSGPLEGGWPGPDQAVWLAVQRGS
ncbi:DUF3459 domain-containing protein [Streptomyces sp. URMC 128]|uniref:DUF3459 domain-containing protein n=1 Tax=Streptomyces sp. URMC 128 TaxID=3423404 RepID=UPI003F19674D